MRAAAAFEMSVCHFGVSRLAIGCLCLLTAMTACAWIVAYQAGSPVLTVGAGVGLVGWFSARWRPRAFALRWDMRRWHLRRDDQGSADPGSMLPGRMTVAIDLGLWMLLKFAADARPRSTIWLPVQKWGMTPHWHALRCTVYAARAGNDTMQDALARPSHATPP